MLPSFNEYCAFIAQLSGQYPSIRYSTLQAHTIGPFAAEVEGQVFFELGYVLDVWELVDLSTHTIYNYSYELRRAEERIWWYDPQSHPNDPTLASTDPHHKHIHPDIKHHRVPAPEISFARPNLSFLVQEVEKLLTRVT